MRHRRVAIGRWGRNEDGSCRAFPDKNRKIVKYFCEDFDKVGRGDRTDRMNNQSDTYHRAMEGSNVVFCMSRVELECNTSKENERKVVHFHLVNDLEV